MLANRFILFLIAILLPVGGGAVIASDDNPWSMDEPASAQQPYFDLESGGVVGFSGEGQKSAQPYTSQPAGQGATGNETIRPKTPPVKAGVEQLGKGDRDQYFGYAGPQPPAGQGKSEPADRRRNFGRFPEAQGFVEQKRPSASVSKSAGGVQFGGKSYGAFPPREQKPVDIERQQWQAFQAYRQRQKRQQSTGFANVAPPPVPEPVPERYHPYAGYGMQPGFGTGIAPGYGAGGYGLGGLGTGYGTGYPVPGMPGMALPGFRW